MQNGYQALDDETSAAKLAPAPLTSSQYEVEQSSKSISNHQAMGRNRPPNRPLVAASAHSISNAQALGRELYPLAVVKPSGCSVVTNLQVSVVIRLSANVSTAEQSTHLKHLHKLTQMSIFNMICDVPTSHA